MIKTNQSRFLFFILDTVFVCFAATRPDNFLVFTDSTSHVIFRMDLTTHNFVLVPLHRSGNPVAIDYDPVDGRIYWTDVVMREIHSVTADAQNQLVVRYLGGSKYEVVKMLNLCRKINLTSLVHSYL